jgi:hypothetical protein
MNINEQQDSLGSVVDIHLVLVALLQVALDLLAEDGRPVLTVLTEKQISQTLNHFMHGCDHRLNMEVDLKRSMSRDVHRCTHWLRPRNSPPPSPRIWTRITKALLVSKDRRHLFVTPWL